MELLKKIYIYIFSAVGLVLVIIGAVELINLGLRAYVFMKADVVYEYPVAKPLVTDHTPPTQEFTVDEAERIAYENQTRASNRQRQAANAIALLIVGVPLFWYHWRVIRNEKYTV